MILRRLLPACLLLATAIALPLIALPAFVGATPAAQAPTPREPIVIELAPGDDPNEAVRERLAAMAAPAQAASKEPVSACTVAISETVNGAFDLDPLPLCETAEVEVTMGVTCPTTLPLHMVFVIGRHLLMEDHLDEVKRQARSVLEAIDFTPGTKVGVVSVSIQQRVEQELTESKSQAASAISRIRLDRVDPLARYTDWIGRAQQMLEKARTEYGNVSPIEIILVYSTGCPDVSGADQYCNRQVASANKAKGLGMTVVGVCKPDVRPFGFPIGFVMGEHCRWLRQIASNGYYYDLRQAPSSANDVSELGRESVDLGLELLRLTEILPPGIEVVPGSMVGSPIITPTLRDGEMVWEWADVRAGAQLTATWTLSPTVSGVQPVRAEDSQVLLMDDFGRWSEPAPVPPRDLDFEICVGPTDTPTPIPPTATPTPTSTSTPTATPPATDTPEPTPTPEPGVAYLPAVLKHVCLPGQKRFDVVLAIDASSSMTQGPAGQQGIDAARDAAGAFLDLLSLDQGDRASIVAFNAQAYLAIGLGADRAALDAAIAGITPAEGTRIDAALAAARDELSGPRATEGNDPVLVLLTDGLQVADGAEAARSLADGLRADGVRLFTVGLGEAVDSAFLEALAGDPARFLRAPSTADLRAAFESIARDLPCPGGVIWPLAEASVGSLGE